jgi:quercetin dioxygenase-like cupin family protein
MPTDLPRVVRLPQEALTDARYENHIVSDVNDHVVRISVMTEPYPWHRHPNSDETFIVLEGSLLLQFEAGELVLQPGDLATVPAGVVHRTRPATPRSVNVTIERADLMTDLIETDG